MGKSWIVLQKPISNYSDKEGVCYNYPTRIPNGRRINTGDYLVCSLTKKTSKDGRRLFGIGRVESVTIDKKNRATAFYGWYKEFDTPFTFEEIGGDPRNNQTNSINAIPKEREEEILDILLREAEIDPVIKAKESDLEYKLTGKRTARKRNSPTVTSTDINKNTVKHIVQSVTELHRALIKIAPYNKWRFGEQLLEDYNSFIKDSE